MAERDLTRRPAQQPIVLIDNKVLRSTRGEDVYILGITSRYQKGRLMPFTRLFTSESVCAGHPDKICDQVSDAIVDAVLTADQNGRAAVETLVTADQIVLAGEVRCQKELDFARIARAVIRDLGYVDSAYGFSDQSPICVYIHRQSQEIACGVDQDGAGDQGMMFGYACKETPELMPMPIVLAHALVEMIDHVRRTAVLSYLRPDGKAQVTVQYAGDMPIAIDSVVIAVPHFSTIKLSQVRQDVTAAVIEPVLARYGFTLPVSQKIIVNGTGVWHQGGPASDTGITGRKIVVDTYGGYARVGGGCFSGKDPTKVDRSGAYAARYLAKRVVAAGLVERAEVSLAYCIGQREPVMKTVETFGMEHASRDEVLEFVNQQLDCSVRGIITWLDLWRPIYQKTAVYGHFGRDLYPWE